MEGLPSQASNIKSAEVLRGKDLTVLTRRAIASAAPRVNPLI